ncbi:MAG: hypothetical protein JO097_15670 [Acidobacteriaceae bacterium]|nr:hypothetical protein [Acidobacteriaceae bacterium]
MDSWREPDGDQAGLGSTGSVFFAVPEINYYCGEPAFFGSVRALEELWGRKPVVDGG